MIRVPDDVEVISIARNELTATVGRGHGGLVQGAIDPPSAKVCSAVFL